MVKLQGAIFLFLIVKVSIGKGSALTCLKCNSTNVDDDCRTGTRPTNATRISQTCNGNTSACFIIVAVSDQGQTYFQRGCSDKDDICQQSAPNVLACHTCKYNNCNYNVIEIDNKNEDYKQVQNSQNKKNEMESSDNQNQENQSSSNQKKRYKSTYGKRNRSSIGINRRKVARKSNDPPQKNISNKTSNATDLMNSNATQLESDTTKIKEALIDLMDFVAPNEQMQKNIEEGTLFGFGVRIKKKN